MLSPWPTDFDVLAQQKKTTATWTYVDYEWPNTDCTGNSASSYVVVDTVRFWPKWRSLLLSSDSSAAFLPLKEESHIVIRALGKQDVRLCVRTLQRVIYGYITLVGTRNSTKKVDHPLFTTIHPPPEVQHLKQRYALTCSAPC